MEVIAAIPVVMVLTALVYILKGWVLSILWGWFVVPTFHLPPLNVVTAIGVSMVFSYAINGLQTAKINEEENTWKKIATMLLAPFVVLGTGWIIHQFM